MSAQLEPKVKTALAGSSPGGLVLQWLTYAFWGWTVLALTWLTAISVGFFLDPASTERFESTTVAYSLAAVIVLFLISLICDIFFSRREALQKSGASMVIMIIHAVLFALCGIGALIIAVFAVVRLLIGDSSGSAYGDSGAFTMLITGSVIATVYGATVLRTLHPVKLRRSSMIYWVFMSIVTLTVIVLGVAGPTWNARLTRDDRLIERGLPQLSDAIRSHSVKANELPATLDELRDQVTGDAGTLIDRELVEYTPGKEIDTSDTETLQSSDKTFAAPTGKTYNYTLCVNYKAKKGSVQPMYAPADNVTPDTYYHDAGRVCYVLKTNYSFGKYY